MKVMRKLELINELNDLSLRLQRQGFVFSIKYIDGQREKVEIKIFDSKSVLTPVIHENLDLEDRGELVKTVINILLDLGMEMQIKKS